MISAEIELLTESLKEYISINYELIRLQAVERSSVIGSGFISSLLVGAGTILCLFFISFGAGFYLSSRLGDTYSGFGIVAGFYLLLVLLMLAGRKKLAERFRDSIIRKVLSKN